MAVLITGGYGHIGSWMAALFAESGEEVIIVDINGKVPEHLEKRSKQIRFLKKDIRDFSSFLTALDKYRDEIDGIVHTVGIMGEFVADRPRENVSLNIIGTLNILEAARLLNITKVVYTSTGAVYGPVRGVAAEETVLNPADLYAVTKVASEHLGLQYAESFGLDFRIGRVYFVYGPGKLPSRFVRLYRVAFGVLEDLPDLLVEKSTDQKLDFTYIEDAARGLVLLYGANRPPHRIYNIATGIATSVADVAALARGCSRTPVSVEIGPGVLMPRAEALDITRARAELGYEPRVALEDGIERYAAWLSRTRMTKRRHE